MEGDYTVIVLATHGTFEAVDAGHGFGVVDDAFVVEGVVAAFEGETFDSFVMLGEFAGFFVVSEVDFADVDHLLLLVVAADCADCVGQL